MDAAGLEKVVQEATARWEPCARDAEAGRRVANLLHQRVALAELELVRYLRQVGDKQATSTAVSGRGGGV